MTRIAAGSYRGEHRGVTFFVYRYVARVYTVQNARAGYCTSKTVEVWDARLEGETGRGYGASTRREALRFILNRIERISREKLNGGAG